MHNAFLTGQRVYFRPVERTDAPLLAGWINNPQVWRTIRQYLPKSLAQEEAFLERTWESEHDILLLIVNRVDDQPLGAAGLNKIDFRHRHAEFGLMLGDPDQWNKGYGTEATRLIVQYGFDTVNLHRIYLHVHEDNIGGIRAYEKVGFRREGVLRQDVFREGRYLDTVVMGLLRDEWGKVDLA